MPGADPYLMMLQEALAALRPGAAGGMPDAQGGMPPDAGSSTPGGAPAGMRAIAAPPPGGARSPMPLGGANLGDIAKMLSGMGGGGQLPQPERAPMGGGGKLAPVGNPLQQPQQQPAPMAQGPQSIGALLASPMGQKLLAALRAMQQGQPMNG